MVALVIAILAIGFKASYHEFLGGNFTATPDATWTDIVQASHKEDVLVVVYKPDSDETKQLKPVLSTARQQYMGDNPPKMVYVKVTSKVGQEVLKQLGLNENDVPILAPVDMGSSKVKLTSHGQTQKTPATKSDLFQSGNVNKVAIQNFFTFDWTSSNLGGRFS